MSSSTNYYKRNIQLALPLIAANMGQAVVAIVDNIMVGQLGATQLAAASFAGVIVMNFFVFGMGVAISLTPLAGHAYSSGRYKKVSMLFQNSLSLNLMLGVIIAGILFAIIPLLHRMGQPVEVVNTAIPFYKLLAISTIPYFAFLSFKQFMEGVGNTRVAMFITIFTNLLNVVLNYVLIYGKLGAPAMGIVGAGVSTLVARCLMPILFFGYVWAKRPYRRFLSFFRMEHFQVAKHRQLLDVGLPISGQMVIEFFALSVSAIMMGWLGTNQLAANQVVLSVVHFTFMISVGISEASTILVSHAFGAKNFTDMRKQAYAGMQMAMGFMLVAALTFIFFGEAIASVFTSNTDVIRFAGQMFLVVALFELSDGLQITALGALRGITDVKRPMVYALLSYLFINIPAAYFFGFVVGWGVQGIWLGFFCGLTVAAFLYIRRFRISSRRLEQQYAASC